MTVHSLFQPPILLAVALIALVIGTCSESGMMEVEEDRCVCLACQARHFPAIFSSRRALRVHIHSQEQESEVCAGMEQNKNNDSSRRCDCRWIWGNGTLPSSATLATGWSIHAKYTVCIPCIYIVYYRHVQNIFHACNECITNIYRVYSMYIQSIYMIYT